MKNRSPRKKDGAEDYIVKPFKAEELEATIRGKLLRSVQINRSLKVQNADTDLEIIHLSGLTIDPKAHHVFRGEEKLAFLRQNSHPDRPVPESGEVISLEELGQISSQPKLMPGMRKIHSACY